MPLSPVSRTSLTDEVFGQLVERIVAGDLATGEALPSERKLAEVLGVSRPAVREALQRLAQTHLVSIRQGGSTTVRDWSETAGLDLLPHLLVAGGRVDPDVVRSIIEVRGMVGPLVAGLAARRADADDVDGLHALVDELAAASEDVERQRVALRFWDRVVDAANSIALRLMFNALRDAYEPVLETLSPLLHDEVSATDHYRDLTRAIAEGDSSTAEATAHELLAVGTGAMGDLVQALEAPQ